MKKAKILYIEDEAKQREALAAQLHAKGFDVISANSGKQGLAHFHEQSVNAIVCDLHMPGMEGIEVLENAYKINPEIPFILLTANGSIPEAVKALKIGAFDFLLKPVDIDHLENTITNAIEHKKLENELKNYSRNLEIMVRERTEKLEYTNRQLGALNDVSNKFTQIFDEEKLYDEVPHLLCHSLNFDRSSLFLEKNGALTLRSFCFEKDEELARQIRAKMKTGTLEIPGPILECFATCRSLFIENPNEDPRWPKSDDIAMLTKSIAITPLKAQGICVGLLVANMEHHEREMDQQDIARFEMFARMVGLAVDNIRAYKSLERKVIERTQSLREANKKLRAKTKELEKSNYSLGKANVDLLSIQEEMAHKNKELTQKEEELRTIIEASPIPYAVTKASDGTVLFTNKPLAEILNHPVEKLIGQKSLDYYYNPNEREFVLKQLEKHGKLENYELQLKKADGTPVWMLFSLVTTELNGESVILSALYNIDERKRAEQALQESEELFRQLTESINDVFWMRDAATKNLLYVNPAFEKVYGRSQESHFKSPDAIAELTHPDDLERLLNKIATNLLDETPFEFRIINPKDGSTRWLRTRTFPIRNEAGDVIRIGGLTQDFTKSIESEIAMRESEERFRSLVENASDLIYTLQPNGTISYISPNCKDILGYGVEEFIGKSYEHYIHSDDLSILRRFFADIIRTGKRRHSPEYLVKHKDEGWRWNISNASPLKNDKGEVIRIIGIAHDVTELKNAMDALRKTNIELRETQSQLVQSEKMAALGNLVAGIAHEINTPVGAINSMHNTAVRAVEKLKDFFLNSLPPELSEDRKLLGALKIIENSNGIIKSGTERVINIVRRLRSFARLDEAEVKEADIHEGLEDSLTLAHHELKHRVTVHKNFGDLPRISCYPGRLNQVFLNMIVNASQAIKEKGEITITTYRKDNKAYIEIKDTGVGIPKDNLKKIFDPGFTTKGVGVGTGLGLSICYRIIQDHQGEIKVESEVGKGTIFTIILPMDLDKRLGVS